MLPKWHVAEMDFHPASVTVLGAIVVSEAMRGFISLNRPEVIEPLGEPTGDIGRAPGGACRHRPSKKIAGIKDAFKGADYPECHPAPDWKETAKRQTSLFVHDL